MICFITTFPYSCLLTFVSPAASLTDRKQVKLPHRGVTLHPHLLRSYRLNTLAPDIPENSAFHDGLP
jgi:hypothetical protein